MSIAWTDATWNPTRGCSRVSEGCGSARGGGCYAERQAARFAGPGGPYARLVRVGKQGPRWTGDVRLVPEMLDAPLRWRKPRRVFVDSMSDLFHEKLSNEDIAAIFGVMACSPRHTYQILTKRAERMRAWFNWAAGGRHVWTAAQAVVKPRGWQGAAPGWPLPHVWLGVSVEDQQRADERIPHLLDTPAAVRFVSYEPALGPVDFTPWLGPRTGFRSDGPGVDDLDDVDTRPGIDWLIVGGESGPGARPFDLAWARAAIAQCRAAGAACFVKQLGARPLFLDEDQPDESPKCRCREAFCPHLVPTKWTRLHLRDRNGSDPDEWPEDLRVREWPT